MAVSDEVSKSWDHLETFKRRMHGCRLERMDTRSSKRIRCSKAPLSRFGGSYPGLHGMIPHTVKVKWKCKVSPAPPHDLEHQNTRSICTVCWTERTVWEVRVNAGSRQHSEKGIRLGFQRSSQWCIPPYWWDKCGQSCAVPLESHRQFAILYVESIATWSVIHAA